ncbi:hypothetical protein GCM10009624_29510 [Gordonia sinesedis]
MVEADTDRDEVQSPQHDDGQAEQAVTGGHLTIMRGPVSEAQTKYAALSIQKF